MTNTRTLIDGYIEQNNKFMKLQDKAQKCIECDKEITKIIDKSNDIIRDVFTKFSSDRKKLGIFILRKHHYNKDDEKETPQILMSEEFLKKNRNYYYEELCVNNTGFSLLPTYGRNSTSILDHSNDEKRYYLSVIKDKRIMDKLKETIHEDKLSLLNRVLQDIELLEYDNGYEKSQKLTFYKLKTQRGTFKEEKTKSHSIKIRLGNGSCRCSLREDNSSHYYDTSSDLVQLDIGSGIVFEQVRDEVLTFINECYIDLTKKKEVMTEYLTKLEERLHKELIVMALLKK